MTAYAPTPRDRSRVREAPILGGLPAGAAEAVVDAMSWRALAPGEVLFREGDPATSAFVVVRGRLDVVGRNGASVGRAGVGELLGEMALLSGEPRAATAVATRDAILAELPRERFDALLQRHPEALLAVTRLLVARLRGMSAGVGRSATVIAVVPLHDGATTRPLADALARRLARSGPVGRLDRAGAAAFLREESHRGRALSGWLDEHEASHPFLLLEGDEPDSAWTALCAQHGDTALLVADARRRPSTRNEAPSTARRRELVLVHPRSTRQPSGGREWADAVPCELVHHVRLEEQGDVDRLARFVSGRAVALVLAGGAVRGAAHIGAIRALEEDGVPIDLVCGTSIGSAIGALLACGQSAEEIERNVRTSLVRYAMFDVTVPVVSVLAGRSVRRAIEGLFEDRAIEDLWRPYFCTSANLSRAEVVLHRRGRIADAVMASGSLAGVLPPVRAGTDLLVDGMFLGNLPVAEVDAVARCRKIAVNLVPVVDELVVARAARVSRLRTLVARFRPGAVDPPPLILDLMMRAVLLGSVSQAKHAADEVDLYVEPAIGRFGFFDLRAWDRIVAEGYRAAKEAVAGLRARDPGFPE